MNLYFTEIHFNEVVTTFLFLFGNVWSLSRIVSMFDHMYKIYLIFTWSEVVTCTTMSSQLTCKYKKYISISILMKNHLMKPFSHKSNPFLLFKSCFLQFRSLHDQFFTLIFRLSTIQGGHGNAAWCNFPSCLCGLVGQSEPFSGTSLPDMSGINQSERAETQQHVRHCDVTLGINLSANFLPFFFFLPFFKTTQRP